MLQIAMIVGVTTLLVLFEVGGFLPGCAMTLMGAMDVAAMESTLSLVALWLVPYCFVALLLLVGTVRFLSWFWGWMSERRQTFCSRRKEK